jgi:hypothetical protein
MSPERIQSLPYSTTCDIWFVATLPPTYRMYVLLIGTTYSNNRSLGMLLVTCALGKFPFKTDKGYFGLASLISEGPPPQLSYEQLLSIT